MLQYQITMQCLHALLAGRAIVGNGAGGISVIIRMTGKWTTSTIAAVMLAPTKKAGNVRFRSKLAGMTVVGALTIALSALGVGVAQADGEAHPISNAANGICLQPENGSSDTVFIVQEPCNGSSAQRWFFAPFGGTNRYQFANRSGIGDRFTMPLDNDRSSPPNSAKVLRPPTPTPCPDNSTNPATTCHSPTTD